MKSGDNTNKLNILHKEFDFNDLFQAEVKILINRI